MENRKDVVENINNKLMLKDKINKNKNNNSNAPVGVAYYATRNAITLLALVITIILLLILAGVTISIVIGPNGLLNKAQETAKQHKIQEIQERLELEKGNASLDNKGKLTLEQYLQHLVDKGIVNKEEIENTENEKAKQITVEKYIFLVEEEENGNIKITYQGEAGKLKPILEIEITQITTNAITVKANGKRMEKGEYKYYIKEIETGKKYELKETKKENEYTYTGLTHNKEYQIKVEAKNENGTATKESGIIRTITLEDIKEAEIDYIYNPTGWTNESITITANVTKEIPEGYRIETSKDAVNWEAKTSQNYTSNGEMYVRITDGTNETTYAVGQVTKIDKQKPIITKAEAGITNVAITATDEASGIIGYAVVATNTEPSTYTTCTNTKSLSTTVEGLVENTTYYVFVKDEAGNVSVSKQFTTQKHTPPTITATSTDTSNIIRKENIPLVNLFNITWGSEGTGKISYEVIGNLLFKNKNYSDNKVTNLSELELGTYNVKCTLTSPSNVSVSTTKSVTIGTLASTNTITDINNQSVSGYAIYSEYDLKHFSTLVGSDGQNALNAKVMENIDMSNVCRPGWDDWSPIGWSSSKYNGTFDGNNKIIDNLYIGNIVTNMRGLFAYIGTGTVKNVVIGSNSSIKVTTNGGGISGSLEAGGTILNCENNATISGNSHCGGITSWSYGTIENCTNNGTVYGANSEGGCGGIACLNYGTINNCKNTASVTTSLMSGGIVGRNDNIVSDCTNSGTIRATTNVAGGIVGRNHTTNATIQNCKNEAEVTSKGELLTDELKGTGGIVGLLMNGTVTNSSNKGNITSEVGPFVGGIAGATESGSNINKCFNYNGNIKSAKNMAGGIVGGTGGCTIDNCYNYFSSSSYYIQAGGAKVAGILGGVHESSAQKTVVQNCYNIGENITGSSAVGIIIRIYWL